MVDYLLKICKLLIQGKKLQLVEIEMNQLYLEELIHFNLLEKE